MTRNGLLESDDGVSEIVGEILVLAITVMVFGLLVVAVNALVGRPDTVIVDVTAVNNSSTVTLTHGGGDSPGYGQIGVVINGETRPFSAAAGDQNGNGIWEIGESLYVANPGGPGLDVTVYDTASKGVLGSFTL